MPAHAPAGPGPAPLWAVGVLTFVNSLGSGLIWSALFFVTRHDFGFEPRDNFLLQLGATVIYILVAWGSGRVVRRLPASITPRHVLAALLLVQLAAGVVAPMGLGGVLTCAMMASGMAASFWPLMESYVSSGRHGRTMRRALGAFNLSWMTAVPLAMFLMAPLMGSGAARWGLTLFVPMSLVSLLVLRWMPARPAPHAPEEVHRHVPAHYEALRNATRFLLPVAYIFIGALGPAMPFLLERLRVEETMETPLSAVWMCVRVGAVVALMLLHAWHGRWSTLAAGFAGLASGFALILWSPDVATLVCGLVLFGLGSAVVYFAAIYYAMAVGGADVDSGAFFETLVGLGYLVGPLAGLALGIGAPYLWGVLAAGAACSLPAAGIWLRSARVTAGPGAGPAPGAGGP